MSLEDLTGQSAVVTGASAGIGRESARALAREGADVALAARSEDRLHEIADGIEAEYGTDALVVPTDVTDDAAVDAMIETAVEAFGGLDIVVLNAGVGTGGDVETLSTEDYDFMMDVNCDGMFFTARAALPHVRESGGHLVFIGSFAGQYARPGNPVYAATKFWTRGFALSLSAQVGDDGIGVTTINPSEVRTEFGDTAFKELFDEGEVSEPEEIAEAVVFAARQDRSMVSELDLYRRDKFTHF